MTPSVPLARIALLISPLLAAALAISGCVADRDAPLRPHDDPHSWVAEGQTFAAGSPEQALSAVFDERGAWLGLGGDEVAVRASGWGREGAMDAVFWTPPFLGACTAGEAGLDGACVQRLEYQGSGLTEWWISGETGFQQGWTVEARPAGEGALVIDVALDGADVAVSEHDLRLTGDSGTQWIVSGLRAWDACGVALRAHFDHAEGGFRVRVEDAGARYPVTIDPVYSSASTTITGTGSEVLGGSVSSAGDVNGDGYDDVIVGATAADAGTGRAYVFLGSASGVSTTASTTLLGVEPLGAFGVAVSGAGDVNADGYDDVIVGASGWLGEVGWAYVFDGSATGVSTTASTTLVGPTVYGLFGSAVSAAGDVNGDGFDDVIVGASFWDDAYIYLGSASGLSSAISTALTEPSGTSYGAAVSGAGDIDSDGYADVLVGDADYSSATGRVYVYAGSASGISSVATTTLTGEFPGSYFGGAVSGAGDANGDGYGDVIIGAHGFSSYKGRAYLYLGSALGLSTTVTTTLTGTVGHDDVGSSVASAGDMDGDGYDDVIVGAAGYSASTGRAFVHRGSRAGLSTTASTTLTGEASLDALGSSVSGAGDVNGDGFDDVIVGAYGYGANEGRAYVHLGYAEVDGDGDGYSFTDDCDDDNAAINPAASEICDAAEADEDCNGLADDLDAGATGQSTFYLDLDNDRYGGTTSGSYCDAPDRYVTQPGDCLDTDSRINPGETEDCDTANIDEDCDGLADDADPSAVGQSTFYADTDGDGWGGTDSSLFCDQPSGYVTNDADCDDGDAAVRPDAQERCNEVDDDCDGTTDVGAADAPDWYADADGDGYTNPEVTVIDCKAPEGYFAATEEDCDDADGTSFPGAEDIPEDGIDQDCDGEDATADTGDVDAEPKGGCACASGAGPARPWWLGAGIFALVARRRVARRVLTCQKDHQ